VQTTHVRIRLLGAQRIAAIRLFNSGAQVIYVVRMRYQRWLVLGLRSGTHDQSGNPSGRGPQPCFGPGTHEALVPVSASARRQSNASQNEGSPVGAGGFERRPHRRRRLTRVPLERGLSRPADATRRSAGGRRVPARWATGGQPTGEPPHRSPRRASSIDGARVGRYVLRLRCRRRTREHGWGRRGDDRTTTACSE
jgi:hypothetical protein